MKRGEIMKFYANLHSHSNFSDGPYAPKKIVQLAKEEGYKAIAVTDHDVARGFAEVKQACEELDMECIFGVEFSVDTPGNYHIMAFDFDPEYPPMKQYLEDLAFRETDFTKKCFDEGVASGDITGITWEEVLEYNKGKNWFLDMQVYAAMVMKGVATREGYVEWAVKNFVKKRKKYPPTIQFKPLGELISLIKEAGGIALVAHPHNQLDEIDDLIALGIEGLEIWHPDLTEEEKERAYKIAMEKNLYVAGGSDHSGLCGGSYVNCPKDMDIRDFETYLEPCSVGTTELHFRELKDRKLYR